MSISSSESIPRHQEELGTAVRPMILNGKETPELSGPVLAVYYPWDNATLIGECFQAEASHIERIERAACEGFEWSRRTTPTERAMILNRLADLLEARKEEAARLITLECGKPIKLSRVEAERAIGVLRGYAVEVERQQGLLMHVDGREARVRQFPIGPVLAVTPYNFPLNLVVHKLAPAIAAGCSMTIKPAPQTPMTALYLGRLAAEAGYQAISVVPASNEVAEALVKSDAFAKISFTGSARVGWYLRTIAGSKTVTLELGGNAALVVEELTQPVEEMAARIAFGAFAFAGQTCISVQRILVNERIKDQFIPALVMATRRMKVGDPMQADTDIGPMITIHDVQRTRTVIKDALRAGANVVYGGNTFNALTMNPTLLDRTTPEMDVNAEEVFAPVATVAAYTEYADALQLANDSRYGLQAGVYTNDPTQIEMAYETLDVGGVIINDIPGYRVDLLPYGGVKDSGLGREGVVSGIADYSYIKTLVVKR